MDGVRLSNVHQYVMRVLAVPVWLLPACVLASPSQAQHTVYEKVPEPSLSFLSATDNSVRAVDAVQSVAVSATPSVTADSIIEPEQLVPMASGDYGWIDNTRSGTMRWLNHTAHSIDDWFGEPQSDRPAQASLRFLLDMHRDANQGERIKPRIRGKIRLPTLERRLSVVIGDDSLDDVDNVAVHDEVVEKRADSTAERFSRKQSRENNASLALRWSRLLGRARIVSDVDLGVRSGDDIYLRLRAERQWQLGHDWQGSFEQIYRYGIDSAHYARSNVQFSQPRRANQRLVNHSYLDYSHQGEEALRWGNSTYQAHTWMGKHGMRELSYGMHLSGRIDDAQVWHSYGPFVTYRQPLWREWFFVQGELSYYNDFSQKRDHRLASFLRLEVLF